MYQLIKVENKKGFKVKRRSSVSRVSKVSKKIVKAGKGKQAKILSAPKAEMKAINEQRAYLAKYRAMRLKTFKKYSKEYSILKTAGLNDTDCFRAIKEAKGL